jgi:hypothetical protein
MIEQICARGLKLILCFFSSGNPSGVTRRVLHNPYVEFMNATIVVEIEFLRSPPRARHNQTTLPA